MADKPLKDKNYNLIASVENALSTQWQMSQYAEDAEREGDQELVDYFRQVVEGTTQGAENGKRLLAQRLQQEGG